MSEYVLTCKQGSNADLFPDILKLYFPENGSAYNILDATFGRGVFWKGVDRPDIEVWKNDIDPKRGDYHHDFGDLPDEWEDKFDGCILDPPYLYTGGFKTLKDSIDRGYNIKERAESGIRGVPLVHQMYARGMIEAYKVLRKRGVMIVKCMDQVMSGKQTWQHLELLRLAEILGFRSEDLFVLHNVSQPTMRHKTQVHARRNHSYFLVLRK